MNNEFFEILEREGEGKWGRPLEGHCQVGRTIFSYFF